MPTTVFACVTFRTVDRSDIGADRQHRAVDYDPSMFAKLHIAESSHFWHLARRRLILTQMKRHVSTTASVLEIGAGTGFVASALVEYGYNQYILGDRYPEALRYARSHLPAVSTVQFDIRQPPFRSTFDVALMFDVIEHLDDDVGSLRQIQSILRPGGQLLDTPYRPTNGCGMPMMPRRGTSGATRVRSLPVGCPRVDSRSSTAPTFSSP